MTIKHRDGHEIRFTYGTAEKAFGAVLAAALIGIFGTSLGMWRDIDRINQKLPILSDHEDRLRVLEGKRPMARGDQSR